MSTPDTFRDALTTVLYRNAVSVKEQPPNIDFGTYVGADAVLASDEMQAIRKALQVTIDLRCAETGVDRWTWATGIMGLPPHVAAWMLEDPT